MLLRRWAASGCVACEEVSLSVTGIATPRWGRPSPVLRFALDSARSAEAWGLGPRGAGRISKFGKYASQNQMLQAGVLLAMISNFFTGSASSTVIGLSKLLTRRLAKFSARRLPP